jgi:hypothetical protein
VGSDLTRDDLKDFFEVIEQYGLAIPIPNVGSRVCIYSLEENNIIHYSWLKLKLTKYNGFKRINDEIRIYFYCDIYKNVYLNENDYNYVLQSSIKHEDQSTFLILKEYLLDKWEGDVRKIQAKAC